MAFDPRLFGREQQPVPFEVLVFGFLSRIVPFGRVVFPPVGRPRKWAFRDVALNDGIAVLAPQRFDPRRFEVGESTGAA